MTVSAAYLLNIAFLQLKRGVEEQGWSSSVGLHTGPGATQDWLIPWNLDYSL